MAIPLRPNKLKTTTLTVSDAGSTTIGRYLVQCQRKRAQSLSQSLVGDLRVIMRVLDTVLYRDALTK